MDPTDAYLYNEFLDPEMEYKCPHCGTVFGQGEVIWDDESQEPVAACPGCSRRMAIEEG